MRIFVIKQDTDLKGVGETLLTKTGQPDRVSLERIKSLNPHLDETRVAAGTVLLVPDTPEFAADRADPVPAGGFEGLEREVLSALRAAGAGLREGLARREEQDKEAGKAIKSAAVGKLAADDGELRKRLDDAGKQATANAKEAKQATSRFDAMEKAVAAELAKLRGLAGL